MLVLLRKLNESIVIGTNVIVTVVGVSGDKVRLGIEAPKEVPVHRREVFDAIHRNEVGAGDKPPVKDSEKEDSEGKEEDPPCRAIESDSFMHPGE